jgi:SPP1 gp7 family putative phage head morphogenesis protein
MPLLSPVWDNAGVAAWYRRQLTRLVDDMHSSLVLHIEAAYKREPPSIGFAHDDAATVLSRALAKWGQLWTRKFNLLSGVIAQRFASKNFEATETATRAAFAAAGWTVKFKPTARSVEAYRAVIAENVNLIKSIPQQYLKDVRTQVWALVMKGGDLGTLSKNLQASYGVTKRRAALIARDQNAKAKAVIENTRRREIGITEAVWMHSHAGKEPRPAHVAMNGKRFSLAKGMWDSVEKEWVLPGQLINCRCTSRALIPALGE